MFIGFKGEIMGTRIKNITITMLLVLVLGGIGSIAWQKYQPSKPVDYDLTPNVVVNAKAEIIIEGPSEVHVGELARLDVTKSAGRSFKWCVLPENIDYEVYDDGRKVIFSSGVAGEYTFIVACAFDNNVDVKYLVVKVVADSVTPPTPPTPPAPPSIISGLPGKVIEWSKIVQSPNKKSEADRLSISFMGVQQSIIDGELTTADAIIEATKVANRDALGDNITYWVPFLEQLQKELKDQSLKGTLVTVEHHIRVWGEIADGLNSISK